jgi:hypothetical protein
MIATIHALRPGLLLLGFTVLLLAFLVGACDLNTGSSLTTNDPPEPAIPENAVLRYAPMPAGSSLPSPSEVPLDNGIANPTPNSIVQEKSGDGGVESPYGCYLASWPSSDSTRFRSIYLYFPEEMVATAGTETKQTVYRAGDTNGDNWIRYARCVMPDAPRAHALTHEQVVRAGETEALREAVAASQINVTASATRKACQTLQVVTLEQCVGGPCCSEWHCDYSITYITICGGGGGGGSGDDHPNPYPGGGDDGEDGGSGSGDCTFLDPPPGSDCEPADPCDGADPPFYCEGIDVNATERCPNDPLKDVEIRATGCAAQGTRSVEGGRFGWTRNDGNKFHAGIDLLNEPGDPVYAAEGGIVHRVATETEGGEVDGWGHFVIIKTASNEWHLYAHLEEDGRINQEEEGGGLVSVDAGDVIGYTGPSGNATDDPCDGGPSHVHYEVRQGDEWTANNEPDPVNPEDHLGTEFDDNTGTAISDSCPAPN